MDQGLSLELLNRGDELRRQGDLSGAASIFARAAGLFEIPPAEVSIRLAQCYERLQEPQEAYGWLRRVADAGDSYSHWQSASTLLTKLRSQESPNTKRAARLAVAGSSTTTQLASLLSLAALQRDIDLTLFESAYGQYQQEILDPASHLYSFAPDFVLLAVDTSQLTLPPFASDPDDAVTAELSRWLSLWNTIQSRCQARVIQQSFPIPAQSAFGHLASRLSGSRETMIKDLNRQLGRVAGEQVVILDMESLASAFGKYQWFDHRYWYLSKQAVALDALPLVARHTAALLAAELGLTRKCAVLDLDNTLWGGIIGEDGLSGIRIGTGPDGEAFAAFQDYLLALKDRGVILAVCSKNDEAEARRPFLKHPEMKLRLEDISMFVANWEPKPANLRRITETLGIGLDALVFIDDNPAERELVRSMLPEVAVIALPESPSGYLHAVADSLFFETTTFTEEDRSRTGQYRAKADIAALETAAHSIEDFFRSLDMRASVAPFDDFHLSRIVQLIVKTNQFNLTTRRHGLSQVRSFMNDPAYVHLYLRLKDKFADHGLVSAIIARQHEDALEIDTWVMSCRVIGRTVEVELLMHLCREAERRGCRKLVGVYIPSPKNQMAKDLYDRLGFKLIEIGESGSRWEYDIVVQGPIESRFISPWERDHDAA